MKKKIIIKHAKPTRPNKAKFAKQQKKSGHMPWRKAEIAKKKAAKTRAKTAKVQAAKAKTAEAYWLAKWEAALVRLKKAKSEYKSAHKACGRQQDVLAYIIRRADARTELRVATEAEPKFMRLFAESARMRLIGRKWKA